MKMLVSHQYRHSRSTDLNAGIWEVGLDIEAGDYLVGSEYGMGYMEIHEKGKEPVLYEVIGGNETGSKSHVNLTEGQKLRVTGISSSSIYSRSKNK